MPTLPELLIGKSLEEMSDEEIEQRILETRKARRNISETKRATKKASPKAKPSKPVDISASKNTAAVNELLSLLKEQLGEESE